jgi:hypothetical protein
MSNPLTATTVIRVRVLNGLGTGTDAVHEFEFVSVTAWREVCKMVAYKLWGSDLAYRELHLLFDGDLLRSYRLPLSVMISGLDDINATDVLDVTYMPPVHGG